MGAILSILQEMGKKYLLHTRKRINRCICRMSIWNKLHLFLFQISASWDAHSGVDVSGALLQKMPVMPLSWLYPGSMHRTTFFHIKVHVFTTSCYLRFAVWISPDFFSLKYWLSHYPGQFCLCFLSCNYSLVFYLIIIIFLASLL